MLVPHMCPPLLGGTPHSRATPTTTATFSRAYHTALQSTAPCFLAQHALPMGRTLAHLCKPSLHLLASFAALQHLPLLKSLQNFWPTEPTSLNLHADSLGTSSKTLPACSRSGALAASATFTPVISSLSILLLFIFSFDLLFAPLPRRLLFLLVPVLRLLALRPLLSRLLWLRLLPPRLLALCLPLLGLITLCSGW